MLAISNFQGVFARHGGPFRYNRYIVQFQKPSGLSTVTDPTDLSFLCNTTSLPGRSLATSDQKYNGSIRKIARESIYNEITFTFYLTNKLNERRFFEDWLDFINPKDNYSVEYYNYYVVPIKIYTFAETVDKDLATNSEYGIELEEAYPISIDPINLTWNNQNDTASTNVTFAYREWKRIK